MMRNIREKLRKIKADRRMISLGFALGVFLGTTPFIGIKVFISVILSSLLKWSKIAAIIGVYQINILTAPLFYGFSFFIGRSVMGSGISFAYPKEFSSSAIFGMFYGNTSIFFSLLIGGLILGIPMAIGAYYFSMGVTAGTFHSRIADRSPHEPFTIITGASSGLGKEFTLNCAKRNMNLILVALPGRNLHLLCKMIEQQYSVKAIAFETDLTDRDAITKLAGDILQKYRVNFLINNAGTGGTVAFDDSSPDYLERIIQLNITAVSILSRLLIPELKKHPKAYILNVSSMAAFSPIPFKTIYPASKAFVYNFSRSLNEELKGTGVNVAVVHPGPILTNPDVIRRIVKQGNAGKIGLLPAAEIARQAIEGIIAGKNVIVPGFMNKVNRFLIYFVPTGWRLPFLSRIILREIEVDKGKAA